MLSQIKIEETEEKVVGKIVEKRKPKKKDKQPSEHTCKTNLCLTAGPRPGSFKIRN
jgi:hypothetical protein